MIRFNITKFLVAVGEDASQDYGYQRAFLGNRFWARNGYCDQDGVVHEWLELRTPYFIHWMRSVIYLWPHRFAI